jgi:putative hydrolase
MTRPRPQTGPPGNEETARALEETAGLLEAQGANPFRVRAYRNAAATLRRIERPVAALHEERGLEGLTELPGIGFSLARSIAQLAREGRLPLLERLRGQLAPERMLATVPGIGPALAARIHETLGIETLYELEGAAWDGRLRRVPGMGEGRILAVRESLAGRFRRAPPPPPRREPEPGAAPPPPVAELLDIDQEYREQARRGRLPRIAPRRFNPTGEAWLPVLHAQREERHYTALFSNTARAHELGTTRDWVVIYRDDERGDGQWTVVTARFGGLRGRRVVRGREAECREHYRRLEGPLFAAGHDEGEQPAAS